MTDNTTTATDEDTSGLKAKNADLLKKLNDEKSARKSLEERLQTLEDERDSAQSEVATKAGDIETIKTQLEKKHAAELKKRDDANDALTKQLSTLKIDGAISDAIAKNGVLPQFVRAATLELKDGATIENGEAVVNGVPLADHIATSFKSEAFKHYVAAVANSGAGAQGSSAQASGKVITSMTEFMALAKTDKAAALAANLDPSLEYLKATLA